MNWNNRPWWREVKEYNNIIDSDEDDEDDEELGDLEGEEDDEDDEEDDPVSNLKRKNSNVS